MSKIKQVNVAFQLLPNAPEEQAYKIIDRAIDVIKQSGIKYLVCPFETVLEGDYDAIMQLIKEIQEQSLDFVETGLISNLKIQMQKRKDVHIEDKTGKYNP